MRLSVLTRVALPLASATLMLAACGGAVAPSTTTTPASATSTAAGTATTSATADG